MPGASSSKTTEPFARVKIDEQLKDVGWTLTDGRSVRFAHALPDGSQADYLLCDRNGRGLAVVEAKRASINPVEAEAQGRGYAEQARVPFVFLANGEEVWFWEWEREAHPRRTKTFFSQLDLERRIAAREVRVDPLGVPIDRRIVDRPYQIDCIETLCREMNHGRRKLLVEMATGTGKTRVAAALVKRLFDTNVITRVLFLVDRITLARQAEDAFAEHLPDFPAYVARAGRRFQDEKRITITTLQTMINEYAGYSSGYFDLVFTDECHRSIYGKWRGILEHFDGIQIGLTATPCTVRDVDRLADPEDAAFVRDTLRFFEVTEPTYRYTLKEAIREGYLVPYHIYKALTVKTAAEGGFDVRRDELDWTAMDDATRDELETLFGEQDSMTVDPSALERKFTIPERNRAIVREFREVMDNGFTARSGVRRAPQRGKTIVFAVTKRHAETLAQMFDREFADKKPSPNVRYADFVVSGPGEDSTLDAATRIERFRKEPFPQIMVSVNMLDTGFDFDEVVNLVMARFTRSVVLYRQMRGRGTRRADHIKKVAFTLFDFVGVTDFHGDDEDISESGEIFVRPKPPTKPGEPRRLLMLDVHDHIDPITRDWITLDDEGNLVREPAAEARAHALGLRFEAWLQERSFDSDQMRLLRMMESQIKANADTVAAFEAHLFGHHPFSLTGGYQRAVQVFGSEEALNTLLADLNRSVFGAGRGLENGLPQ